VLRDALQAEIASIRTHAPNVYAHGQIEELHKLRVAIRRSRALLHAARALVDDERVEPLRDRLRLLGGALGPARDADVFLGGLRDEQEAVDEPGGEALLARVEVERLDAYATARAALDDASYLSLLEELDDFCSTADLPKGTIEEIVEPAAEKLRKTMRAVSSDETLHSARIKAKRLRYAAEAAGARKIAKRAERFQDVVGAHQDAVVAERRLRELADPETSVLVGRLIERQAERRRRARARTPKTWKRLAKTIR
jgi:CHAD domain-containing protein